MSIKSRIAKLERYSSVKSEYCICYGVNLKNEVIPIKVDEWKQRFDTGEEICEKLPDVCERCRKPVDKRFIETTFEQIQETIRQRMNQVMETMAKFSDN